jgi:ABC-type Fe3+/spermidine/putrescine transport system ATPase subunit
MDKGKIMQIGTPEEIYSRPQNIFVAEFIGDSTILKGTAKSPEDVEFEGNIISGIEIKSETSEHVKAGDEVKIILRASDLRIYAEDTDCSNLENVLCLNAYVESSMFIGSKYKHIIRFREQTIFADWEVDYNKQKIKLIIPKDKIRIFK